jgi:ATP-dependent DNA helicase RecQ
MNDRTAPPFDLSRWLLLDIECVPSGECYEIGAVLGERQWHWRQAQGGRPLGLAWPEFESFFAQAEGVLGHNIVDHDLPILQKLRPGSRLFSLPVIDTLMLSPLAFPTNPYHRLIKGYKLVSQSRNNPVEDARLAGQLFLDEWQAFQAWREERPELLQIFRHCLSTMDNPGLRAGMGGLFEKLGVPLPNQPNELLNRLTAGKCCGNALRQQLAEPSTSASRMALMYAASWLQVAGGNSVLPSWVRHRFPETATILEYLRGQPCGIADCAYCQAVHRPEAWLKKFFDFSEFRPTPATCDGKSLQRELVLAGLAQKPLLGILPTGGGKSICFQLPALARHLQRGMLTIVISPLQALMKDQVDSLSRKTRTVSAAALYGMLTPPERGQVLEQIINGDIGILYVSPEQLRNPSFKKTIAMREIACWVFDEAHCLSKWGHDFRTDYLYAGRFIKDFSAQQKLHSPPIACFTATAKQDVIEEIRAYFRIQLNQNLLLLEGGVKRDNLSFEVIQVTAAAKLGKIHELLGEHLGQDDSGAAVVFRATRNETAETAEFLKSQGWSCEFFHAGIKSSEKRRIQESFLAGEIRVICATNAFGMGVDKDNVRLVIHGDIPGSLENYIQEAGRAGRDRLPAECVLLYDEADIERQFRLGALSQLSLKDIQQILRGLRAAQEKQQKRNQDEVIITVRELLRQDEAETDFAEDDVGADTKTRTAIAWLERAEFLLRNENQTYVFSGKPHFSNLAECENRIAALNLSDQKKTIWIAILARFFNLAPDQQLTIDDIAQIPELKQAPGTEPQHPSMQVINHINDMTQCGLLEKGLQLSAFVRHRVVNASAIQAEQLDVLEKALLGIMQEKCPDTEHPAHLSLIGLNQGLLDQGVAGTPDLVLKLLKSLATDGKGFAMSRGSVGLTLIDRDRYRLQFHRDWPAIIQLSERRRQLAIAIVKFLVSRLPPETRGEALVDFSFADLQRLIDDDLLFKQEVKDPVKAIERALLFLHEQGVISLQNGLAVFRQAMKIKLDPKYKGQRYTQGEYQGLHEHYCERTFQIHVMNEYATLGLGENIATAEQLVDAYFMKGRVDFVNRYFFDRQELLEMATTAESYRRIVDNLNNRTQQQIVTAAADTNLLILAGPGSGKTRVVVHRCAWLIRVKRVNPRNILVLCFNRAAAVQLRVRLRDLVGDDARGITVQTYHSLAMRLLGISFADRRQDDAKIQEILDQVIAKATRLLRGEDQADTDQAGTEEFRDRLLAGYQHILVDEYQDINADQYELISAIAGRTLADPERKLAILAVGDDDQNIYAFNGANIQFIRRFEADYHAKTHLLLDNYRSAAPIVDAANRLIALNQDRMKSGQPLRIDAARRQAKIPADADHVRLVQAENRLAQAYWIVNEIARLRTQGKQPWSEFAVLARHNADLHPLRILCEWRGIPVLLREQADALPPLHRIREIAAILDGLEKDGQALVNLTDLRERLTRADDWSGVLIPALDELAADIGDTSIPATLVRAHLVDFLLESKRSFATRDTVLLSTIHAAKGLEFNHVFILGEGWEVPLAKLEEERRLFFVGMTRARQTLSLITLDQSRHPHITALDTAPGVVRLRATQPPDADPVILNRHQTILALADLYLNFTGECPPDAAIHQALDRLRPNDPLRLVENRAGIDIHSASGKLLGRLSKAATQAWQSRLIDICDARLAACVIRRREDSNPEYHANLKMDQWLVPVPEILWEEPSEQDAIAIPFYPQLKLACGAFRDSIPGNPQSIAVAGKRLDPQIHFVVRADGDSMNGGHTPIRDGDLILLERISPIRAGSLTAEIAVAVECRDPLTDDTAYALKKIVKTAEGNYALRSWNRDYPDQPVNEESFHPFARFLRRVENNHRGDA